MKKKTFKVAHYLLTLNNLGSIEYELMIKMESIVRGAVVSVLLMLAINWGQHHPDKHYYDYYCIWFWRTTNGDSGYTVSCNITDTSFTSIDDRKEHEYVSTNQPNTQFLLLNVIPIAHTNTVQ